VGEAEGKQLSWTKEVVEKREREVERRGWEQSRLKELDFGREGWEDQVQGGFLLSEARSEGSGEMAVVLRYWEVGGGCKGGRWVGSGEKKWSSVCNKGRREGGRDQFQLELAPLPLLPLLLSTHRAGGAKTSITSFSRSSLSLAFTALPGGPSGGKKAV